MAITCVTGSNLFNVAANRISFMQKLKQRFSKWRGGDRSPQGVSKEFQ